jgi:predicted flap endonuclease-1-like 5' DNA nuclease
LHHFVRQEFLMSWLSDFQDASVVRTRAARTLSVQIGLANPLWLAYGAAASAGAAWWLMAKSWQPVNLEAQAPAILPAPEPVVEAARVVETIAEPVSEPVIEALVEAAETVAEDVAVAADDLTQLIGVGPKTAAALAVKGVATFADLAAWSADDLAAFDAELKLKGRSVRDAWLEQARALAAG